MTPAEAGVLLAGITVFDNRKPGSPEEAQRTMTLWAQALHDVSLADAGLAVTEHFAKSSEYLMPAHIRVIVKRIRAKRIAEHPVLTPPPELAELPTARTAEWLAEAYRRIGNGEVIDSDAAYGELKPRDLGELPATMRALMPAPNQTEEPA